MSISIFKELCGVWYFYQRYNTNKALHNLYYLMGVAVLLVSGLLLIFLGLDILASPYVLTVASLIPLGISMGVAEEYYPAWKKPFKWFAVIGFLAIAITSIGGLDALKKIAGVMGDISVTDLGGVYTNFTRLDEALVSSIRSGKDGKRVLKDLKDAAKESNVPVEALLKNLPWTREKLEDLKNGAKIGGAALKDLLGKSGDARRATGGGGVSAPSLRDERAAGLPGDRERPDERALPRRAAG